MIPKYKFEMMGKSVLDILFFFGYDVYKLHAIKSHKIQNATTATQLQR